MTKSASPSPSLLPAILALFVLLVVGYILFTDSHPSRTEHTLTPPIEVGELEDVEVEVVPEAVKIDQQALVEEEAQLFIDHLAESDESAITVTEQGGEFVRHDSHILLPKFEHRNTTIGALLEDSSIADNERITLNYIEIEKQQTTLAELAERVEDKMVTYTIETEDGQRYEAPLADLLSNKSLDHSETITVIVQRNQIVQMTKSEISQSDLAKEQEVLATINHGTQKLSIKELVQANELSDDAVFYLHRVTEADRQGLWGIIQSGLIERFREGLVLEGLSQNKDKVQVTIPADADEPLPTGLSSFLGKVLSDKVNTSYIYNFSSQTMGHNPNLIYPGQQLILIHFSADELKRIYLFFAEQRQQQAQSFAVQP